MPLLPHWFRDRNIVPACKLCNGAKEWYRSDCNCPDCTWCWDVAVACFVPEGTELPPVIVMETARTRLEWKIWRKSLPANKRVEVQAPRAKKKRHPRKKKQRPVVEQWDEGFAGGPPPDLPNWML